jgi:hypothetical protein
MELLGKKGSPEGLPKHSNEVGNEG